MSSSEDAQRKLIRQEMDKREQETKREQQQDRQRRAEQRKLDQRKTDEADRKCGVAMMLFSLLIPIISGGNYGAIFCAVILFTVGLCFATLPGRC
jgi:hypothetical protein